MKSGYEKSLGANRYKLNKITYDFDRVVHDSAEKVILNNLQGLKKNSIIIYGVKSKFVLI